MNGRDRPVGSEQATRPDAVVAGMRDERKVVTALFADVVGSTPLGEALDPEEVRLIVGEAVARMVHAVEAFGGTVKDLAGDGVLALFGAPVAHEDDPERAVRTALRILQDVAEQGTEVARAWGIEGFSVRVGISTGPVVLGPTGAGGRVEYGAFGDTVNTAARLQASAEPGSALVGPATHRMVEPLFDWDGPVEVALKGKSSAVLAYRPLRSRMIGLKVRGVEGVQAPLVGRGQELAVCVEVLDDVIAGRGGILFVTGEAGIGKSRLIQELHDRFQTSGAEHGRPEWLEGRCVSYGESLPYWPFRDLLRDWLGVGPDDPELRVRLALRRAIERVFEDRAPEIYRYLGSMLGLALESEARAKLSQLSPEALQYRTFEVVRHLLERLAEKGPVVAVIEDLHWGDPTSIQLTERLLPVAEESAVLLVISGRPERDHPSWQVKEGAARRFAHRTREVSLQALSGEAERALLNALIGTETLPQPLRDRVLADAEGNPFYLEELVRSLMDTGALVREEQSWRFDHEVDVEIPETVEKVILARIDRLPAATREVLTAAAVLGRRFGLPLLEGVAGGDGEVQRSLRELERLDLVREARRWPQPEYRFKHALIQEAAYRTILTVDRRRLHRKAAEWLERRYAGNEGEVFGLLAHHWLSAADEDKAVLYLTRAGDRARNEYALDEAVGHYRSLLPLLERRGERRSVASVLFKLALALHCSLRFKEANEIYQRAFDTWEPPEPWPGRASATLRIATSFLPNDNDPRSAIAWPNIQVCMQLFDRLVEAWPERTIVPSLAERWEISDDGLRYVFHLRDGLRWSDGVPLTAHDVEFGIKRVLNPERPGSSVAIYFALRNGQDHYLGRSRDVERIGVRALDDRTVEFRLAAPAPYFLSVMNRPDGGPQPRHAIERHGDSWIEPDKQVVSGPFRIVDAGDEGLVLERQAGYSGSRPGNVRRVELERSSVGGAVESYHGDDLDVVTVRYTPRLADLVPAVADDATLGAPAWSGYLAFDHAHPLTSSLELRRALAHAVDRDGLAEVLPANLVAATGGVVPPALQGHTPDIALRFDPDRARHHLALAHVGRDGLGVGVAGLDDWAGPILSRLAETWKDVLGLDVDVRAWTRQEAEQLGARWDLAPILVTGWLPGYPDPEYYLRLLFQSDSKTNEGGFSYAPFDELIERARQDRSDQSRLELYHQADRMAVAERVALIPLVYGRSMAFVKPWVRGWWEFGKSSASFADLVVEPSSPRAGQ
jgi:ABC-type oligopeptide transport system substrate-binding subunit/class 3 adenylate cyclase